MLSPSASRRPRVARRALEVARRAPAGGWARARVVAALAASPPEARRIAALLLFEGLSATEAAATLDLSVAEVTRAYAVLVSELRHALHAARPPVPVRGAARPRLLETPNPLRRVS